MPRLIRPLLLNLPPVQRQLSRIVELELQSQALRDQLASLNSHVARLEAQEKKLGERMETLAAGAAQIASLQADAKELGLKIDALSRDAVKAAELETHAQQFALRLAEPKTQIAELKKQTGELARQIAQATVELARLAANQRDEVTAVARNLMEQQTRIEMVEQSGGARLMVLETEAPRMQARVAALEQIVEARLSALEAEAPRTQDRIETLAQSLGARLTVLESAAKPAERPSPRADDDCNGGSELAVKPDLAQKPPAVPYTFDQLLNSQKDGIDLRLLFYVHVPKAAGHTVVRFLCRNYFRQIELHPGTNSFFYWIDERKWFERYHDLTFESKYVFTGHFRLDHAIFRRMWLPFAAITTLRDPIERMLSAYNFTLRVFHSPWHDDVVNHGMSFIDFAGNFIEEFGPQYSYFDDSGGGSLAWKGTKTAQQCLHNLLTKVAFYGFADRFDEFTVILAHLLRLDFMISVRPFNVTEEKSDTVGRPLKTSMSAQERKKLEDLLRDDLLFYEQARSEYDRRVATPQLRKVLRKAAPFIKNLRGTMHEYLSLRDDPGQRKKREPS
jgi:Sulfotransferase family